MALKIMVIIAELIMVVRLVKTIDKGSIMNVLCNGVVVTTLAMISRLYF